MDLTPFILYWFGRADAVAGSRKDLCDVGSRGSIRGYANYTNYVRAGVDEPTAAFYRQGNMASHIVDKGAKEWFYEESLPELAAEDKSKVIQPDLTMEQVIAGVAGNYNVNVQERTK